MPSYSLAPITGELSIEDLLHLLRRTLFGVGHKELAFFKNRSIHQCLDIILRQTTAPKPPLQSDPDITDPLVPNGTEWINAPYENEDIDKARGIALRSWWIGQIINRDFSLTEKMTLFWHNHFVTEMAIVKDSRYSYRYISMLRSYALGNFKKLITEGTSNVAMLVYLNGNSNSKSAPNENYSRELMELFTLGKGGSVNYTENDVQAGARVLSGWKDDKVSIQSYFLPSLHDSGDKQFSAFFENAIIKGKEGMAGAFEVDDLIEIIFKRKETSNYLCRNLYRWFVSAHIDDHTEDQIIAPLANLLIDHNFEVASVLRVLLGSEHFFDTSFRGCIVKSPVDFFVGASKQFELVFPPLSSDTLLCWVHYSFHLGGLGMMIGDPPNVAGWPAFYQTPKYHQWWINTYTLSFRMKIIDSLTSLEGMNCNGPRVKIDFVTFVGKFKDPVNINTLVDDCLQLLCAVEISQSFKDKLKKILLANQPDQNHWAESWNKLTANPNDIKHREEVETTLNAFFKKIINMPEYQMI